MRIRVPFFAAPVLSLLLPPELAVLHPSQGRVKLFIERVVLALIGLLPARLRTPELLRFYKFAAVGGSGVVVNMGVFLVVWTWMLGATAEPTRSTIASAIAVSVSIVSNFLLNDTWTWGDRPKHGPLHFVWRLSKYSLFASIAGVVNVLVLQGLVRLGLHAIPANFIGIVAGIGINYFANSWWTYRAGAEDDDPATDESPAVL